MVDAIDAGDDGHLRDELGDLLLNLAFQIVIAEERGAFTRESVVSGLERKMERRHPHLYGRGEAEPWETIKARERGLPAEDADARVLSRVAASSDALRHAYRIQERVAEVGFDWAEPHGALEKVREEVEEVAEELGSGPSPRLEEEIGDLLFSVVNLARLAGVHPPTALARANAKFTRRFEALEDRAREQDIVLEDAGLEALDRLWEAVKRRDR